jgi:ATP-dependent helicase/DNAse subunit B
MDEEQAVYSPADVIENMITARKMKDSETIDLNSQPSFDRHIIKEENIVQLNYKLKVIGERQSGKKGSIWEGLISENKNVEKYFDFRFGSSRFSPTQLEVYAFCPMIYFFERILGIKKEEISEAHLSPLDRGILIHDILFRFYNENKPEQRNLEELLGIAREELSKISAAPGLLWELDQEHFLGNEEIPGVLPAYLAYDQEISTQYTTRPEHFELSFGRPLISADVHDSFSTEDPFIYSFQKEEYQFSGKIDRIEIAPDGSLLIVDYKSGTLPTLREMWDGQRLQLPIYLLAVYHQLKVKYPKLKVAGGAFYSLGRENKIEKKIVFMDDKSKIVDQDLYKSSRFPNSKFKIDNSAATLQEFMELVMAHAVGYIQKIRKGLFAHTLDDSRCRSRNGKLCEYLAVCRVNWMKQSHLRSHSSTDQA